MSEFRRQLLRSLAANGGPQLRVVPKESATEWLLRVGPIAKRMNAEARKDPK